MYPRILVPLDGSDMAKQVLSWVKFLAKGLNSRVELLWVVQPIPEDWSDVAPTMLPKQVEDNLVSNAQEYLNRLAKVLQDDGLSVTTSVRVGHPADCIVTEAARETDTLVAMTTHGRSGVGRWLLGSVTDKVLHSLSNPLLIVRANEQEQPPEVAKFETLIVPLDGSPLAERILPQAESLAKALRLNVLLARAVPSLGEYHQYLEQQHISSSATVYSGMYEEFSREADARSMEYLHRVREQFTDHQVFSVQEKLLRGKAADSIIELAQEVPHSLVTMTTHGHSGIGRLVLGSVTDQVVRQSRGPVLVVKASDTE